MSKCFCSFALKTILMKTFYTLLLTLNCFFLLGQAGNADTTFNSDLYERFGTGNGAIMQFVERVCEQPDGKLILAGTFTEFSGISSPGMVRVNTDGSVDHTFNPGEAFTFNTTNSSFTSVILQEDGRIIATRSEYSNGLNRSVIRRLNIDGSEDTTPVFPGEIDYGFVYRSVIQPDGKLILCGDFIYQDTDQTYHPDLVRFNTDGTLDNTFADGQEFDFMEYEKIHDMKLGEDGSIFIAGGFNGFGTTISKGIICLNPDGTVSTSFNTGSGANGVVRALSFQPDGMLIIAGEFSAYQNQSAGRIIRVQQNGSIDPSFYPYFSALSTIKFAGVMPDNSIFAVGDNSNQSLYNAFVLINPDGTVDTISGGTYNYYYQVELVSSGKLIATGQFETYEGRYRGGVARINPDLSLDASYGSKPGFASGTEKIIVQPDGKMYAGKVMNSETDVNVYNDTLVKGLVRITTEGSLDTTFALHDSLFVSVDALARQVDGKILVGGIIKGFDGLSTSFVRHVSRFNIDGSIDASFAQCSLSGFEINTLLVQPDGKIIVLGDFFSVNGNPVNHIARIHADGTFDNTFITGSGTNSKITAGTLTNSGKIIIGGDFTTYNGVAMQRFGSINPDGTINTDFAFDGHVFTEVIAIEKQFDGKIYVAAEELSDQDNYSAIILRLNLDGSVDPSFSTAFSTEVVLDQSLTSIKSIRPQPDGKLLLGGQIIFFNENGAYGIARLKVNGTKDEEFNLHSELWPPAAVTIALGTDGKIIAGGNFSKFAGVTANGIVVLENDLDDFFEVTFSNVSALSCSTPGTVTASAYGGVAPYEYFWENSDDPTNSSQLINEPGIYTCSVVDASGIFSSASLLISGPAETAGTDLKVNLTAGPFRSGFDNTVALNAFNDGCIPVSGQLICIMDTLLLYNSAVPVPDYQSNDTLIWDFSDLTYNSGHILPVINCTISSSAAIGDTILIDLLMTPVSGDADTLSNRRAYSFPVINGYDPNIKSVYPPGKCDEGYISSDQKLTYTVQFQNTGNAEAITIVVVDSLNENLDIHSLRVTGSSHYLWTEIAENNTVKFHFDQINLPDSTSNEPGSHGYVVFDIDLLSSAIPGNTVIANEAGIYFDFNVPVITNTCTNTIHSGNIDELVCVSFAAIGELETEEGIVVYPNPTDGVFHISFASELKDARMEITDVTGKLVYTQDISSTLVKADLTQLSAGFYKVRVIHATGISMVTLIKE